MVENRDQSTLREWITAGLNISGVRSLHGDAGYLLNNMIAKYSLSADKYRLSEEALLYLEGSGFDATKRYKRSFFYGKKSPLIYEHPVPVGIVREQLVHRNIITPAIVQKILSQMGPVYVLMRTENERLNMAKLRSKMPVGWSWGDDILSRYHHVEIIPTTSVLLVCGAICR